jgi:hypothetical protein
LKSFLRVTRAKWRVFRNQSLHDTILIRNERCAIATSLASWHGSEKVEEKKKENTFICMFDRTAFSCFPLWERTLSVKNLLVCNKYLRRASAGTAKRREFE